MADPTPRELAADSSVPLDERRLRLKRAASDAAAEMGTVSAPGIASRLSQLEMVEEAKQGPGLGDNETPSGVKDGAPPYGPQYGQGDVPQDATGVHLEEERNGD